MKDLHLMTFVFVCVGILYLLIFVFFAGFLFVFYLCHHLFCSSTLLFMRAKDREIRSFEGSPNDERMVHVKESELYNVTDMADISV